MTSPIVLVGCGNMGRALLEGWLAQGMRDHRIVVVEPDPVRAAAVRNPAVEVVADPADLADPDDFSLAAAVVFSVKPQQMAAVVPPYARAGGGSAVFVSIAAGTTLAALRGALGASAAVVRAMPNTPAQIRQGITVACAGAGVSSEQRALADRLLAAVGEVAWVDDEVLLDPVTAVSGSGPAYVFLLAECLAEAAVAAGLPAGLAERLARRTVAGAGALLAHAPESAARLRHNVTSPGGTTAAALAVLDGPEGLRPLLARAVAAATGRARELGGPPAATPRDPGFVSDRDRAHR